jgi:methylglyoxal synthase
MLSGPMEEMRKLRRVAEGKTKMVLFFKDPLAMLMKKYKTCCFVCDVHNVPTTNDNCLLLNRYRIAIIEISIFTFFGKHDT